VPTNALSHIILFSTFEFSTFELYLEKGELRKQGQKIRLQE